MYLEHIVNIFMLIKGSKCTKEANCKSRNIVLVYLEYFPIFA